MVARLLSALLAGTAAADDHRVARLVRAAGAALGLTPRAHRMATAGRLALTTAVRVVDGVHRHTAHRRALALPAHAAGLAPVDVGLLRIADLADRGTAADVDVADLTGRHAQLRVGTFLRDQLDGRAGRASDLRATAGPQLDGVHHRADRDVAQRKAVAGLDVGARPVLDPVTLAQPVRREDVALLAVLVVEQRDPGGAVRVVLDVSDPRRHAVLVVPTEVDQTVGPLVAAALVPGRDAPGVVAATALAERTHQRLLGGRPGDLDEVGD